MIDGCNQFGALCRVVLPLAAPGIAATASGSIGLRSNDPLNVAIHASTDDLPTFITQVSGAPRVPVTGTFETTVQVDDANKFARLLVLASHRWTKMLVRRQARPFEIIVGVG